jgi:branched-chain amino acid transport system substrate-binding protein
VASFRPANRKALVGYDLTRKCRRDRREHRGRKSMRSFLAPLAALMVLAGPLHAADKVKVGFLSTLSGPSAAIGIDIRDGFNLVLQQNGGKLGGLPAEVAQGDDQQNPDTGKQLAERLLKKDRVDFVTGIVFTNVMLAVAPAVFDAQTFLVSANSTPQQYSGEGCSPWFFSTSWQNDGVHEAAGKYVSDKGYSNVVLVAPNYPAGKDALTGFKRFY